MSAVPKPQRLRDPKAIKTARAIHCLVCGSPWNLAVHHIKSKGSGGGDVPDNLITICGNCHGMAHSGEISKDRLRSVLANYRRILEGLLGAQG